MIYNLMLKGYKDSIIILSNQNKDYIENEIKSLLLTYDVKIKAKANLIIKENKSKYICDISGHTIDWAIICPIFLLNETGIIFLSFND